MTHPPTFLLHDAAGNTYGPVAEPLIIEWIRERRITPDMTVAAAGDARFIAIAKHPLFSPIFAALDPLPPLADPDSPPPVPLPPVSGTPPTCGYAITALFLSLGGLLICPILPAILALWYARRSLRRIASENADGTLHLGGRALAKTAIALSLAGLLLGAGCLSALSMAIFSR